MDDPSRQAPAAQAAKRGSNALRDYFIERARTGMPEICTYAWAYRHLIGPYSKWSMAYAKQVVSLAHGTPPKPFPGLGVVRLDAFVVSQSTRRPGEGHWEPAGYSREDWEAFLGDATLLK